MEGFWQMMKFPEGAKDPRWLAKNPWPYTRAQVAGMVGFKAKRAGDQAKKRMKALGIHWISFDGEKIEYKGREQQKHYALIRSAMIAKLKQNPKVLEILLQTKNLVLRPDHHQKANAPPAWRYHRIYMELRALAQQGAL